jgi:hypothetical protein
LDGISFNVSIAGAVFDLDAFGLGKLQDEQPFVRVPDFCPADCSATFKKTGLPASSQK